MKEKDFIYIEFVGKEKDTNEVFDTSNAEVAKKNNIYDEHYSYGPFPIIAGAKQVIPGLEEELKTMKVGEKKTVEVPPEKAFGERKQEMVQLLPMSIFKENNLEPEIERTIDFNGIKGKIVSIDGGRVKVDFNNPLAGKTIIYDIEVVGEITDSDEKVKSVVRYFTALRYDEIDVEINNSDVSINVRKADVQKRSKKIISDTLMKWMDNVKKVSFIEVFEAN